MHTALKIFDFSAKDNHGNIDKVAIKLSGKSEALNSRTASEFMKIMGTMMALDPEQVQASLDQLERVPLDGEENSGFAPLIDLSGEENDQQEMLKLLLSNAAGPETSLKMDDDCCDDGVLASMGQVPMDEESVQTIQPLLDGNGNTAGAGVSEASPVQNRPSLKVPFVKSADPGTAFKPIAQEKAADTEIAPSFQKPTGQAQVPEGSSRGTADKTPVVDPQIQSLKPQPDVDNSHRPPAKAPETDQVVKTSEAVVNTASAEPAAKANATMAPPGRQKAMQSIRQAMGEKVKMDAEPANYTGQSLNTEVEEEGAAQNRLDGTETGQRTSSGRDGFQNTMSRLNSHMAKGMDQISAEKGPPAPSKEMQTDVMRQIVQRMTLRTHGSQSRMQIHLKPEFLGNVHMQISTDHQQVAVRMTAESMVVKEMIEQHLSFLKTELQQHGLQIDKFDIYVGSDSEGWKNSQDPSGFRQALKDRQHDQTGRRGKRQPGNKVSAPNAPERERRTDVSEIDYFA